MGFLVLCNLNTISLKNAITNKPQPIKIHLTLIQSTPICNWALFHHISNLKLESENCIREEMNRRLSILLLNAKINKLFIAFTYWKHFNIRNFFSNTKTHTVREMTQQLFDSEVLLFTLWFMMCMVLSDAILNNSLVSHYFSI